MGLLRPRQQVLLLFYPQLSASSMAFHSTDAPPSSVTTGAGGLHLATQVRVVREVLRRDPAQSRPMRANWRGA
ncbi:MAG TPA: hypothetical protein VHC43_08475 [Mycobacteriales bacterium]|nr:hypothetical protein [Mycobacteriales bacterium]